MKDLDKNNISNQIFDNSIVKQLKNEFIINNNNLVEFTPNDEVLFKFIKTSNQTESNCSNKIVDASRITFDAQTTVGEQCT